MKQITLDDLIPPKDMQWDQANILNKKYGTLFYPLIEIIYPLFKQKEKTKGDQALFSVIGLAFTAGYNARCLEEKEEKN